MTTLTLVSHVLCPYAQRAAIAMAEKGVAFTRLDVDLGARPDWFTRISPLGKVPLLIVDDGRDRAVIFESAVILEYLEETQAHPLHPANPLARAQHRSWIEFGSAALATIARLYNAPSDEAFATECDTLRRSFGRIDQALADNGPGPFFDGDAVSLVDVTYGPIFRYFDAFEDAASLRLLDDLPRVSGWRTRLAARASIRAAVADDFPARLVTFLLGRRSVLSRRMTRQATPSAA